MTTGVSICSAALLQLGKAPISSFESATDSARLCSNLYGQERDALLREHYWNCAIRRDVLAPVAAAPAFGFGQQFALPSDFLRLIQVGDFDIGSPNCMRYKIEGRRLLASGVTALPIVYVFRNDQEATWDAQLVHLMTARMLWKLAYPVTQSTSLREELAGEYKMLARQARSIDSQEDSAEALSDDFSLISGRF